MQGIEEEDSESVTNIVGGKENETLSRGEPLGRKRERESERPMKSGRSLLASLFPFPEERTKKDGARVYLYKDNNI